MSNKTEVKDRWINCNQSKKLSLRFRVKGFNKQFYLSTGLIDTQSNRSKVRILKERIESDIFFGEFDPSLEKYKSFNQPNKQVTNLHKELTIGEIWVKFVDFKSQILELSTIRNYEHFYKLILKLPTDKIEDAPTIREFLLKNYSYDTAYKLINALSRCCDWAASSKLITTNPFANIQLSRLKKSSNEDLAYTIGQRDLIICAFENHPTHNHYANLIKFLFWTGCRPGEAFALTWGDINPELTRITINKSYASRVRVLKGTKNGRKRIFPCTTGGKVNQLLLAMRKSYTTPESLLFTNKSGLRVSLRKLDDSWRGYSRKGIHYPGVVRKLAEDGIIPYLKPYSTRHTFATWAIASGCSPDKVAYWLGDDVATVLTYYCHPEVSKSECPDF